MELVRRGDRARHAYANGNPVSYLDPFGLNAKSTGDSVFTWVGNTAGNVIGSFLYSGEGLNTQTELYNNNPAAYTQVNGPLPQSYGCPVVGPATALGANLYYGNLAAAENASWALFNDAATTAVTAGLFGGAGSAAESEMVQIFRTVDQNELPSVLNGTYGSSPSASGKYFALTQEGAQNVANSTMNAGQQMTMTSTTIPRSVFNQGYLFNDTGLAGPAIHFQQEFLPTLYNSMTPIKIH